MDDIELGNLRGPAGPASPTFSTSDTNYALEVSQTAAEPLPPELPERGKGRYENLLPGFPRTARFIATDPDNTLVIFRRFHELSVRNLYNLEARVAALEAVQRRLDEEDFRDFKDNKDIVTIARSWEDFALLGSGYGTRGNPNIPDRALDMWGELRKIPRLSHRRGKGITAFDLKCDEATLKLIQDRWDVALAIQDTTKEYEEAVLRYRNMLSLERPPKRSWLVVKDWFEGIIFGEQRGRVQFLTGSGMHTVFEEPRDWVSLRPMAGDDPVSKKIAKSDWILRFYKKDYVFEQVAYVPETIIHRAVTIITLSIAIFFLVAAVWVLWVSERTHFTIRLAVLTVFVILFGLWINIATNATRSEVFGATAAYAAVLVVFVGKG